MMINLINRKLIKRFKEENKKKSIQKKPLIDVKLKVIKKNYKDSRFVIKQINQSSKFTLKKSNPNKGETQKKKKLDQSNRCFILSVALHNGNDHVDIIKLEIISEMIFY